MSRVWRRVQYVGSIDLRSFDGSIETFVESECPDVMVVLYDEGMLQGPDVEPGGVIDFR